MDKISVQDLANILSTFSSGSTTMIPPPPLGRVEAFV